MSKISTILAGPTNSTVYEVDIINGDVRSVIISHDSTELDLEVFVLSNIDCSQFPVWSLDYIIR